MVKAIDDASIPVIDEILKQSIEGDWSQARTIAAVEQVYGLDADKYSKLHTYQAAAAGLSLTPLERRKRVEGYASTLKAVQALEIAKQAGLVAPEGTDEEVEAIIEKVRRTWRASLHPRHPAGTIGGVGGQFRKKLFTSFKQLFKLQEDDYSGRINRIADGGVLDPHYALGEFNGDHARAKHAVMAALTEAVDGAKGVDGVYEVKVQQGEDMAKALQRSYPFTIRYRYMGKSGNIGSRYRQFDAETDYSEAYSVDMPKFLSHLSETSNIVIDPSNFRIDIEETDILGNFLSVKKARELLRSMAVSSLMSSWAQSSNKTPLSRRIQRLASEMKFGGYSGSIGEDQLDPISMVENNAGITDDFIRSVLQAQYDDTQKWFSDRGIEHVRLYRGMKGETADISNVWSRGLVPASGMSQRPLSSWSYSEEVAKEFAELSYPTYSPIENELMLSTIVPVDQILSTAMTGLGCKEESEFVVLGDIKDEVEWLTHIPEFKDFYIGSTNASEVFAESNKMSEDRWLSLPDFDKGDKISAEEFRLFTHALQDSDIKINEVILGFNSGVENDVFYDFDESTELGKALMELGRGEHSLSDARKLLDKHLDDIAMKYGSRTAEMFVSNLNSVGRPMPFRGVERFQSFGGDLHYLVPYFSPMSMKFYDPRDLVAMTKPGGDLVGDQDHMAFTDLVYFLLGFLPQGGAILASLEEDFDPDDAFLSAENARLAFKGVIDEFTKFVREDAKMNDLLEIADALLGFAHHMSI